MWDERCQPWAAALLDLMDSWPPEGSESRLQTLLHSPAPRPALLARARPELAVAVAMAVAVAGAVAVAVAVAVAR